MGKSSASNKAFDQSETFELRLLLLGNAHAPLPPSRDQDPSWIIGIETAPMKRVWGNSQSFSLELSKTFRPTRSIRADILNPTSVVNALVLLALRAVFAQKRLLRRICCRNDMEGKVNFTNQGLDIAVITKSAAATA